MHFTLLYLSPEAFNSIPGKISRFLGTTPVTPVFLVIMGYFLSISKKSVTEKLIRGLKILFWGILLNIGLNLNLLLNIYNGIFKLDPYKYLFGVNIFFLAGFCIILITMFSLVFKKKIYTISSTCNICSNYNSLFTESIHFK